MKGKVTLVVIGGLLIGALTVSALYFFVFSGGSEEEIKSAEITKIQEIVPSKDLLSYQSESGFAFDYPDNVLLQERELDEDQYDNLALTNDKTEGMIIIEVKDTEYKELDGYLEESEISTESATIKEITLGDIIATEITAEDGAVLAVAFDQGVLFVIEASSDNHMAFWREVYETVIDSFAFVLPEEEKTEEAPPAYDPGSSSDIIFEGEEIIE